MPHRFDYLLGFLDPLVTKNIAEHIPTFLRAFFVTEWPHQGLTTPAAFRHAIWTTFHAEAVLSNHPLVYALEGRFFRYGPSVPGRAPWSLPTPRCPSCGPGSQVWAIHFQPRKDPTAARYQCKHCRCRTTMPKPLGVTEGCDSMWEVEWETYVRWNSHLDAQSWTPGSETVEEPPIKIWETVAQYLDNRLPALNRYCRLGLLDLHPNLSVNIYQNTFETMEIPRLHWQELIRLVTEKSKSLPNDPMDTT